MARDEVELALSGAPFGGDPRGFIDFLGLNGRPLGDNRWAVWPSNDKVFVSHHGLADGTEFLNRFDHLTQLPMNNAHLDDPAVIARFAEHDRQLAERMAGPDIAAVFHSIQSDILKCSSHDQLIAVVEQACALLGTLPLESTGELLFSNLNAHLVIATDLLIRRVRLPAIMFRFDQDPDAMETIASIGDEGGYFASSTNWFQDVISASHYFGPLLGCLSPGFWCVPTGRPPAAILFNLGTGIASSRRTDHRHLIPPEPSAPPNIPERNRNGERRQRD
ncbi:MAG: hypothetical protein QOI25_777 [Mycobacterium sp.]|nr:hypothetical protein [Mycobacterium sp.]